MTEIWKDIKDYEGLYQVSNLGRVRSLDMYVNGRNCKYRRKGKVLKFILNRGYARVDLRRNNTHNICRVHRLVAETFPDMVGWTEDAKGKSFDELQINHKDKNRTNNCVDNLEWCTCKYNNNYLDHNELVAKAQSKTVYMYTLNGGLCGMWLSTQECGKNGFIQGNVSQCCNGKYKTHKGFKWSYEAPISPKALPHFKLQ